MFSIYVFISGNTSSVADSSFIYSATSLILISIIKFKGLYNSNKVVFFLIRLCPIDNVCFKGMFASKEIAVSVSPEK